MNGNEQMAIREGLDTEDILLPNHLNDHESKAQDDDQATEVTNRPFASDDGKRSSERHVLEGSYLDEVSQATATEVISAPKKSEEDRQDEPNNAHSARASIATEPHSAFSPHTRRFIILMAALCGFVSPLSGNIYFPALNALAADLHVSQALLNISLTTYLIFQGLSPTFMGDMGDTAGRRPAFLIGFVIYTGANIGLALQTSYPALLVLRCVQAAGSSSTIALGAAVAADIATASERGTYMGLVQGGALAGPALGPILGGILAQYLGWRSIFWFLTILGAGVLLAVVLAFPETGRNVVGNGSIPPQSWNRDLLSVIKDKRANRTLTDDLRRAREGQRQQNSGRKLRFPNPLATLKILREKDVRLLLLYNCLVYCAYYSVTSTVPYLFQQVYGFDELQIGLVFLPYGIGALLASLLNGRLLDWRFRHVAKSINVVIVKGRTMDTRNFPLERVRLPIALILLLIGNTALLCYGWVLQVKAHLAAPLVLLFLIGYCINGGFNCCSVALVDYCEAAVIIPMINAMGKGWCFTFVALVIYITTPILLVLMKWGPKWREERAQRIEAAKEAAPTVEDK